MKIFNVAENFRKNGKAAIWFYLGIAFIVFGFIKMADPATYDAKLRTERAWQKHQGIRENEYDKITQAYTDMTNAEESPWGMIGGVFVVGAISTFVGYRVLSRD